MISSEALFSLAQENLAAIVFYARDIVWSFTYCFVRFALLAPQHRPVFFMYNNIVL